MKHVLPEEQLIEYAKSYLKAKGFKKKNKRWTKDTGEFTLCFYIQGSSYSKEDYYIRPGIFINALMPCDDFYGHFMLEIEPSTPEEVVSKFDDWCEEWTNKSFGEILFDSKRDGYKDNNNDFNKRIVGKKQLLFLMLIR